MEWEGWNSRGECRMGQWQKWGKGRSGRGKGHVCQQQPLNPCPPPQPIPQHGSQRHAPENLLMRVRVAPSVLWKGNEHSLTQRRPPQPPHHRMQWKALHRWGRSEDRAVTSIVFKSQVSSHHGHKDIPVLVCWKCRVTFQKQGS